MPTQDKPAFSLTSTYVPTGDRNNLAAFVAVNSDPGPDYGTFRVLELPRSVQINGPSQVQNAFSSNDVVAQEINILKRGDSTVKYGNLLTLPVGGGLLYVEPVYVQASTTTAFPLLRKVLVQFGDNVAFEDTLQEALDSVFSGDAGATAGDAGAGGGGDTGGGGGGGGTETPANNPALRKALADAERALADSQEALAKGDFTAYGEAQDRLKDAIAAAVAAQGSTPSPSGSPSPSPSGSGSASSAGG
jgi:uncharacterized protein